MKLKRVVSGLALLASITIAENSFATDSICNMTGVGGTLRHIVFNSESEYNNSNYLGIFADAMAEIAGDYAWGVAYKTLPGATHSFALYNAQANEVLYGFSAPVTTWSPYGAYHGSFLIDGDAGDQCMGAVT